MTVLQFPSRLPALGPIGPGQGRQSTLRVTARTPLFPKLILIGDFGKHWLRTLFWRLPPGSQRPAKVEIGYIATCRWQSEIQILSKS
jgi:hypothetical protein